jgi:hypothetical protein
LGELQLHEPCARKRGSPKHAYTVKTNCLPSRASLDLRVAQLDIAFSNRDHASARTVKWCINATICVSDLHQNTGHESRGRDRRSVSRWMSYESGEMKISWVRWSRVFRAGCSKLSEKSWRHITRLCVLQLVLCNGLLLGFREFDMFAQHVNINRGSPTGHRFLRTGV